MVHTSPQWLYLSGLEGIELPPGWRFFKRLILFLKKCAWTVNDSMHKSVYPRVKPSSDYFSQSQGLLS